MTEDGDSKDHGRLDGVAGPAGEGRSRRQAHRSPSGRRRNEAAHAAGGLRCRSALLASARPSTTAVPWERAAGCAENSLRGRHRSAARSPRRALGRSLWLTVAPKSTAALLALKQRVSSCEESFIPERAGDRMVRPAPAALEFIG